MGTIAEKLTYLNDTRLKIKDGLNKFGADLTENDTFRSYSNVLNDVYDKLPKVSGNGSNFTLENAQNGKLDLFEMEGNTYQDSYSGKNLYGISDYSNTTNGVEITIKDGVITLNGTCTNTTTLVINSKDEQILNGNYTTSLNKISGTYTGTANVNFRHFSDDSVINGTQLSFTVLNKKFTVSNEKVKYGIYFEKDSVFNNFKFRPQLVVGTEPDYDYEPYTGGQPSPNPDYPQQIKVVENKQVVNVHGKNLFDKDNVNTLNAYISLGNSKITSSNSDKCLYMPIKNNTTYTISKILSSRFVIGCVDEEPVLNSSVCNPISGNQASNTTYTITSGNNSKYLVIFYYTTSDTLIEQQILDSIQIEYGNTATPYEPYHNQDYGIDLGSIELCKIGDYQDVIFKNNQLSEYYDSTLDEDSWYLKKNIGKVVLDTSNITLRSNYTNIEYAEITKPNDFIGKGNYDDYNVYCSHAISDIKNAVQYAWDSTYRIGKITNKANAIYLWLGFSKGTGLDNIKTALNGAVIYYALATPTYEKITNETLISQLEAIETETGTNIFEVSNENNVLPSLNVKRLKELEKLS